MRSASHESSEQRQPHALLHPLKWCWLGASKAFSSGGGGEKKKKERKKNPIVLYKYFGFVLSLVLSDAPQLCGSFGSWCWEFSPAAALWWVM